MRAYVFTDASLASEAGRFVWLEIDTERPVNAPLRKQLGIRALPTFYVLDPADERIALRWVGGASLDQLTKLLADGRAAVAQGGNPRGAPPDTLFARAERLYGVEDNAGAATAYLAAIQSAPAGWPHYAHAVESALFALSQLDSNETSAVLADQALPRLRGTVSSANVAGYGISAALALPATHPKRAAWLAEFERAGTEIAADPKIPLSGDDRSGLYISLLDARQDANDSLGARRVAEAWSQALDEAAAKAPTPDARVVYDSHRLSAYLQLNEPEKAVAMLQRSEQEFPDDYNPPARLALAYRAMKRWDDAIAASDRALAKVYGPRTLTVLSARTDIYLGMRDSTRARETVQKAIATAEAFPTGQRSENTIASLKKRLATLRGTPQ